MPPKVKRALLSVTDKTGLVELARGLSDLGIELISSGGTAQSLTDAGVPVTPVEDVTGAPEMLSGRVKTLHPKVHGGILADRGKPEHLADIEREGIQLIDLVVVNLYPFTDKPGIETIDVGGPTMVRAAAKNHAWVGIVTNPTQYDEILSELRTNDCALSDTTRRDLALEAFATTAAFDAAIVQWLQKDEPMPKYLIIPLEQAAELRYGENPHQQAARYQERNAPKGWIDATQQLQGKELSFINLLDVQASWSLVNKFATPACVIVKHANPCGVAIGKDPQQAYERAFACDSLSAFGGVVALNQKLDVATAQAIMQAFTEVVIASEIDSAAAQLLQAKKNLRVLIAPTPNVNGLELRRIDGGFLVQEPDVTDVDRNAWQVVTKAAPTEDQWQDLIFAWTVCASVSSNAIVLAKAGQAFGIGAGQQSRVHATEIAVQKADGRADGGVCASDAFFPFPDGVEAAAKAGVTAIIQPGGSVKDNEVIAAADERGIAMVFTGQRHFRH